MMTRKLFHIPCAIKAQRKKKQIPVTEGDEDDKHMGDTDNNEKETAKCSRIVGRMQGTFYRTTDESAFVLHQLTGYKVIREKSGKCRVGFPVKSLDKIEKICTENCVDYVFYQGENVIVQAAFDNNTFDLWLSRFNKEDICDKEVLDKTKESMLIETSKPVEIEKGEVNAMNDRKEEVVLPRQMVDFVQGQGTTLENAIMDAQRAVTNLISSSRRIVSISLVENGVSASKGYCVVQGLVIYEL